jgi:DNA-binding transcriptional LysR family regulator
MRDLRRIDLNLLVALHALLAERSVTRAARRLSLTQPTVSTMLVRLRKLFNDPLFVRTQRGILPTPRALALEPALGRLLEQAGALIAGDRFDAQTAALTFSISANDYIQSALLIPFIRQLRARAPNVRIAVRPASAQEMTAKLAAGELDIAITTSPEIPSLDLPSRVLYEERYVCAVRKEHPLRGRSVTLEQFCRFPHVVVSPTEGGFVGPTDRALAERNRQRRVALSVPGFLILPELLRTEDLVAVVPERVLASRSHGLRTFAPPLPVPGFAVLALWHPRVQMDPAHRWMRELLSATAAQLRTFATRRSPG